MTTATIPNRGIIIGEHRALWKIAAEYLPKDKGAPILCVGPGRGLFEREYLEDRPSVHLVEPSIEHADSLKQWIPRTWNVIECSVQEMSYASNKEDRMHFSMCSHVIEHLDPFHVHLALRVLDSETEVGGILVLASPCDWPHFWADLTHVRPYHPEVFIKYLCDMQGDNSMPPVSQSYELLELAYSWSKDGPKDDTRDQWKDYGYVRRGDKMEPAREPVYRRNSWLLVLRKGA